ncbi:MAG: hypothetical protein PSW75_07245 [bacterium]|nr:hypothetical protein [bacterium]MDI1337447.1 hypothetical protein [Lacunisphaera sp.]
MKTLKLLIAAAVLAGVSTLAFAGPGPDWLARAEKERAAARAQAAAAQAATQPKTEAAPPVVACTNCSCGAMKKS